MTRIHGASLLAVVLSLASSGCATTNAEVRAMAPDRIVEGRGQLVPVSDCLYRATAEYWQGIVTANTIQTWSNNHTETEILTRTGLDVLALHRLRQTDDLVRVELRVAPGGMRREEGADAQAALARACLAASGAVSGAV